MELVRKSGYLDLLRSELSYQILIVQRNKYICFMAGFLAVTLNVYARIMKRVMKIRADLSLKLIEKNKEH